MKKFLCSTVTSLLILGSLSSCSSKTTEAPVVILPDVSTDISPVVVAPTPEIQVEETIEVEEGEQEEEDLEDVELDGMSSATIEYATSSAKIIQLQPHFIVADEESGRAMAIINDFEESDLIDVTIGSLCQIDFVDITYEEGVTGGILHEIGAYFVIPITQGEDKVGAFAEILRAGEENLSDYTTITMDLSDVTNLNVAEKEALLWYVAVEAGENVTVLEGTEFSEGILIKLTNNNSAPLSFEFEKITWFNEEESKTINGSAKAEIETGLFTITTN